MMVTVTANPQVGGGEIIEAVITKGDLARLTPAERTRYYVEVCRSVGLNPLTKPFEYITLNGKLTLYALRTCADQLRKINGISVEIVSREISDGLLTVHVRAKDAGGRTDEDFGVVSIANLKGEAAANAILKGVTKAKRRVTLSISGLGFLDESEVEDIPANAKPAPRDVTPIRPALAPTPSEPPHDPDTGEILPPHTIALREDERGKYFVEWGAALIAAVKSAKTQAEIDEWIVCNQATLDEAAGTKAHNSVTRAIAAQRAKIGPEPEMLEPEQAGDVLTAARMGAPY